VTSSFESLTKATVRVEGTIRDVMLSLERSGLEIALVIDESRRLVGIMTDGDVRRVLLRDAALDAKISDHMQRTFVAVSSRAGRAEVIDIMQARYIQQVPIVDADGQLIGLHLLHAMISAENRPNWAVVMAGGRGTRLVPMTDQMPKPMLKVAGRPILERIVLHLVGQGVRRIFLSINYLGHVIREHFGDGSKLGAHIEYLAEDRPLGTGGALSLLPEPPTAPVVVMNGDLVTQADIGALLAFHETHSPAATMAVRKYFHTIPFFSAELDGDRLVRLDEKPTISRLVNAGIYVLSPELIVRLPRNTPTTVPDILGDAVTRGLDVRAFEIDDEWIDVGHREQLTKARGDS
jgi:dTDP-glucose pyrophosphorylase/predicted transcriptional regulator